MNAELARGAGDRPPTMRDVATAAGVGLKTVSRYVNGETNIADPLRVRIAEAIELLGYRRNLAAASIRPGWTSKVIGLITSDLANPYYSTLAHAAESVAWQAGYLLTTFSSEEDGERHDLAVDRLIDQRVDALLIVPPRNPGRAWSQLRPPLPPVVFLDRPAVLDGAPAVLADNAGGAREAAIELARNGARRIAFVGDSQQIYTMAERLRGYLDGLAQVGLTPGPISHAAHSQEEARGVVSGLLAEGAADAIFAANNRAAMGALHAFADSGGRLPMIAFDDFEAAEVVRPRISVVSQDVARMGALATEIAIRILQGTPPVSDRTVLGTRLILRGSEKPDSPTILDRLPE
ncbi:LacI family DNA-binding transcriptional regulator [Tessaracoccus flavus]|uniref:LacI family transcriptional regulator n=1 Tax=Tessaracoccus flavus TaxID=1610493 RepID=A0A1Q2CHJ7_9ACTN|nr:LacI family DNA-binding transcriptional regulator [Tessaracoccus flavus]AQP45584.1 LacI family transcriptional regulator [Tessaracoccus flavus]SDY78210.1 transcriptional regulator, LacI family [Tessaracoccus flavus]